MRQLVLIPALLAAAAAPVSAGGELTEQSPSTLEPREVRLGLFDVGIGLWGSKLLERIEISTHHLVWASRFGDLPSYDARIKFEFWREDKLSLAVSAERMHVDLLPLATRLGGSMQEPATELSFNVTPLEAWGAYRVTDRLRVTSGLVYTSVELTGRTEAGPIPELAGSVGTSNLEWSASAQYHVSRSWYLISGVRVLGYQRQWADASGGDAMSNSGGVHVEGDPLALGHAWGTNVAAHLMRRHFNLRLGVEYGNYHIPIVNFVAPQRGFLPTLDLYWRF